MEEKMDDLDKAIQDAKDKLAKTQKLAELNALNDRAATLAGTKKKENDPMERMLKWAFPAGCILAGIGVLAIMLLHNFFVGLTLGALGAFAIGIKIGLTPGMPVPFMDRKKEEAPARPMGEGNWIPIRPPKDE